MSLTLNSDHVDQALARLLEQFKNKPVLASILTAIVDQIQDLENTSWELYTERLLDGAEGAQVDNLGAIVGQPRNGLADADYLNWIRARIRVNRSNGDPNDILAIADLIIDVPVNLTEEYPAGYVVRIYAFTGDAQLIYDILDQVRPAGVWFNLEYSPEAGADIFEFSVSTSIVEGDTAKGFSEPAQITGGKFAGALGPFHRLVVSTIFSFSSSSVTVPDSPSGFGAGELVGL